MGTFKYSSFWLAFKIYSLALLLHTIIGSCILSADGGHGILSSKGFSFLNFFTFFFWGLFFSGITSFIAFILLWIIIAHLKKNAKDFHSLLGWLYFSTTLMAFLAAGFFMLVAQIYRLPNLFYYLGSICCAIAVATQHKSLKNMWAHENRFQNEVERIGLENLN
jgi:hypothetical protein